MIWIHCYDRMVNSSKLHYALTNSLCLPLPLIPLSPSLPLSLFTSSPSPLPFPSLLPSSHVPSLLPLPPLLPSSHVPSPPPFQIDMVGLSSWQAQLKGKKTWTLHPPPECEHVCEGPFNVTMNTGDVSKCETVIFRNTCGPCRMQETYGW